MSSKRGFLTEQFRILKWDSGTHSPSIATLKKKIPELTIDIDACFLSNPYATELFLSNWNSHFSDSKKLRDAIEYYPSQNKQLAEKLASVLKVSAENVFVGNGAIEIIQAIIHNFFKGRTAIILPTFSSYYEYIKDKNSIDYYYLRKENNFELDVDDYISFVKNKPEIQNIVIINPNNPTGTYIKQADILRIASSLSHLENILIDESFIHFVEEVPSDAHSGHLDVFSGFKNVSVVKSLSKDFGIAGIRLGYAFLDSNKVNSLTSTGYLWNISGFGEFFIGLYSDPIFQIEYIKCREEYNKQKQNFGKEIAAIKGLKTYPSEANFILVELLNRKGADFCMELLADHSIYVRDCSDKIGIQDGDYIRLAIRTEEENIKIINSLKAIS